MENIVFYFSGTGNSLKVAKSFSKELENCEIISMTKPYILTKQYDSIGFVYPTYFWGLPKRVIEFIENVNLDNNRNAYFYSVTTYGGDVGNAVYQMYKLLHKKHGIKLNYGQKLQMFSNYIIMYDMSEKIDEITKNSNEKLVPIIEAIKAKRNNNINKLTNIFGFVNKSFIKKVSTMDKNFTVNDNCTGCGICKEVCPVKNIEVENNEPQYSHHCEQCLACIQFCPQKAINYKNVTQNRKRYTNPEINYKELSKYNNK
ncbi:iron-sulfur protein [Spirochaetia bacterium]|nr:iron-sulfur protein [Spirochaetia bacterium]GHU34471.1 iron-sulfur protein [Spirochaetia bacterium]